MKKAWLLILVLFYLSGIFSIFLIEDKSISSYCGEFLHSLPESKSNPQQKKQLVYDLADFEFLIEGESLTSTIKLLDTHSHHYTEEDTLVNPLIKTTYLYFREIKPESNITPPLFIPS